MIRFSHSRFVFGWICTPSCPASNQSESLYLEFDSLRSRPDFTLWLELLLAFAAVRNLYLAEEFMPGIAAALRELAGGMVAEVFPSVRMFLCRSSSYWNVSWKTENPGSRSCDLSPLSRQRVNSKPIGVMASHTSAWRANETIAINLAQWAGNHFKG